MGDAAGELADRLHLLQLAQLGLDALALGHVREQPAVGVGQLVPGRGQCRDAPAPIHEHEQGEKGDRNGSGAESEPDKVVLRPRAPLALSQEALLVGPHLGDQRAGLVHEQLAV